MKRYGYFILILACSMLISCAGGWTELIPVNEGQIIDMGNYKITVPHGEDWSVKTNMPQGFLTLQRTNPNGNTISIAVLPGKLSKELSSLPLGDFVTNWILTEEEIGLRKSGEQKKYNLREVSKKFTIIDGKRFHVMNYRISDYRNKREVDVKYAMFLYLPFDYKKREIFYNFLVGEPHKVGESKYETDLTVIHSVLNSFVEKDPITQSEISPLIIAVNSQDLDTVKSLIDSGADVNARIDDKGSETVLSLAVLRTIEFADKAFVDKCLGDTGTTYKQRQECSVTPDISIIKALIDAGSNVNQKYKDGRTLLERSITRKGATIPELLLKAGADVKQGDPLILAAHYGNTELTALLAQYGVDINKRIKSKDVSTYSDYGSYLAATDSAISKAQHSKTDMFQLLNQFGANKYKKKIKLINKYTDNATALHFAAINGYEETVKMLLELGIDINAKNKNADTALILASMNGYFRVVRELINYGADLNILNNDNYTALKIARNNGRASVVDLLEKAGAKE